MGDTRKSGYVNSYTPRFNVSLSGELPTRLLGNYQFRHSWTKRNLGTCSEGNKLLVCKDVEQRNWYRVRDYTGSIGFFPGLSPLTVTGQNILRESGTDTSGNVVSTRDRVESRAATWNLNIRRMPRLILIYQQAELKPDSGFDVLTRAASAMSDSSIGKMEVRAGYQFSESESGDLGSSTRSTTHGLNLDVFSEFSPGLMGSAYVRVVKTDLPDTGPALTPSPVVPGVDIFPQRSYGGEVFFRPHLGWWDARGSVAYAENPFVNDFETFSLSSTANMRFSDKLRSGFGAFYSDLETKDTQVSSILGNSSLNYRPIFGLTTGLSASAGLTDSNPKGATLDTETLYQSYLFSTSYLKPLRKLQYQLSHSLSYGISDTQPIGSSSRNLANTVAGGLDNTNTRYIHVGLQGSLSNIQTSTDSTKSDQNSYQLSLSADSNYFRNLLFRGDSLSLRARDVYRTTSGFGIDGTVNLIEAEGNYNTPIGLSFNGKYLFEDYPRELLLDRQIFSGNLFYARTLFRSVGVTLSIQEIFEDNRFRKDVNRIEGTGQLNYQLGRISMSVNYLRVETRTSGSRFVTTSVFGQASRAF